MFVCITGSGTRTLRETLAGRRLRLARTAVKGSDGFLTVQIAGRRFPAQELLRVVRRCGCALLCSREMAVPDVLRPYLFVPQTFPRIMTLRTLIRLLREARIDPARLRIGVDDPNGAAAKLVPELLPYCAELRVSTQCMQTYDALALRAFCTSGACVVVRDGADALHTCNLTISGSGIFFAGETWRCADVRLPQAYAGLCPAGIEADLFAAALFERSHVYALSACTAQSICTPAERKKLSEAAVALRIFFEKNY